MVFSLLFRNIFYQRWEIGVQLHSISLIRCAMFLNYHWNENRQACLAYLSYIHISSESFRFHLHYYLIWRMKSCVLPIVDFIQIHSELMALCHLPLISSLNDMNFFVHFSCFILLTTFSLELSLDSSCVYFYEWSEWIISFLHAIQLSQF